MSLLPSGAVTALEKKATCYQDERKIIGGLGILPQTVPCVHHCDECPFPDPDPNLAGPHCNEYSLQGNLAGREGWSAKSFLAHIKVLKSKATKLAVLENVVSDDFTSVTFPVSNVWTGWTTYIYIWMDR